MKYIVIIDSIEDGKAIMRTIHVEDIREIQCATTEFSIMILHDETVLHFTAASFKQST